MTLRMPALVFAIATGFALTVSGCRWGNPSQKDDTSALPDVSFADPTVAAGSVRPATPLDDTEVDPISDSDEQSLGEGRALNPTQSAVLTAQSADAEINLRTSPSTEAEARGYGLVGDQVQLLRSIEGKDGYTWYYLRLDTAGTEGWIRGDFIDAEPANGPTGQKTTQEAEALAEALEGACRGVKNISHAYSTPNYTIYICHVGSNVLYVSHEKGVPQTLVSRDVTPVRGSQTDYVATSGNFEYRISPQELVVYRIDDAGAYIQVLQEAVATAESYSSRF